MNRLLRFNRDLWFKVTICIIPRGLACLSVAIVVIAMQSPTQGQDLTVDVVQDPNAGTATYSIDLRGPSSGELSISSFAFPLFDPNWIINPLTLTPSGWESFILPRSSSYWNFNSVIDPKANSGFYGPIPNIWDNPPWILEFSTDSNPILPGTSLGGFQFTSTQLPVNGPIQFQMSDLQVITIDPPVPGPVPVSSLVPEPSTHLLLVFGTLSLIGYRLRRKNRLLAA